MDGSDRPSSGVRFRLRFLLQEFDLPPGDTLIGRSEDCRITLFDPLISRRHACIRVDAGSAVIEDMGSRNGSRVNGVFIRETHPLQDGDRVRIGTQELVFCDTSAAASARQHRQTGSLCYCDNCQMAYPEEMGACPTCGARASSAEIRAAAPLDEDGRKSWALDMLIEMLKRAIESGRTLDAERIMHQAVTTLHERLTSPPFAEPAQIEALGRAALRLAEFQRTTTWAPTISDAYRLAGVSMPKDMADAFARFAPDEAPQHAADDTEVMCATPGRR